MIPTPSSAAFTTLSSLTEAQQKSIFLDLVQSQDAGTPVPDSRSLVAEKHRVTVAVVKEVEREGLDEGWLDEMPNP